MSSSSRTMRRSAASAMHSGVKIARSPCSGWRAGRRAGRRWRRCASTASTAPLSQTASMPPCAEHRRGAAFVAGVNSRFVLAAAAQRLGRRPRLATAVLRLPGMLPRHVRAQLYRSFSWPLAKRLLAEPVVSVAGGSRMRVRTVDSIGRVLAISGVWEPNVTAAFRDRLATKDVCVDVGAHLGYFTLLASKLVGPDGHVYAFEPSPSNYDALCANIALNGVTNVSAFQLAVGETAREARLYEGPGTNTGRA